MRKAGQSRGAVAEALGVHLKTITRWSGEHKKHGAAIFATRRRGPKPGEARHLSPEQEKTLQRMIADKTPDQWKLAFALWTRRAVCELIEQELALRMPIRTCGEYLKRWGFTPQKPARRAYEQNPAAVRRWMGETYPAIAAQAREEGAEIHWGDETGVRRDAQHGRCYAPKGQTPVVRLPARRFSVNMISTVTNQGKVRGMIYRDTLNSAVFILVSGAADQRRGPESLADRGQSQSPSQPAGQGVARPASGSNRRFLPAFLQPGAQSRRRPQWRLESLLG